jgi:C-terminal processing protease CtpA/Prc
VEFVILKDGLYIVTVDDIIYQYLCYQKISYINDIPALEVVNLADMYCPADKNHIPRQHRNRSMTTFLLRNSYFYQLHNLLHHQDRVELTYVRDGNPTKMWVEFDKELVSESSPTDLIRNSITRRHNQNYYELLTSHQALYFQLNIMPSKVDHDFLDALFAKTQEYQLKTIILDLRNNGGGNSRWCNAFLSHLIKERRDFSVYQGWQRKGLRNVKTNSGIIQAEPRAPYFGGELVVLTSPRTFSSATFFVVAVQDNQLGRVVGEPCGNNQIRYGYTDRYTLPNTKIMFYTTKRIWERNKKSQSFINGPLLPDVVINPSIEDFRQHVDPVFRYIEQLIND